MKACFPLFMAGVTTAAGVFMLGAGAVVSAVLMFAAAGICLWDAYSVSR